mmetsp:Transcript_13549/g.22300  ORF Transcript_13549/g.22300 Transcript_13549/m.22300 type:complete len:1133 (+) Transcript_13549:101-3499(+)
MSARRSEAYQALCPPSFLICPVCQEVFNTPKILSSCGHSICNPCLFYLVRDECPTCRKPFVLARKSKSMNYSLLFACNDFLKRRAEAEGMQESISEVEWEEHDSSDSYPQRRHLPSPLLPRTPVPSPPGLSTPFPSPAESDPGTQLDSPQSVEGIIRSPAMSLTSLDFSGGARRHVDRMRSRPSDVEVQRSGCLALWISSENDGKAVQDAGGIHALVAALQQHAVDKKVQRYGCGALAKLSSNNLYTLALQEAGGTGVVAAALQRFPTDVELQRNGCLVLWHVRDEVVGLKAVLSSMQQHADDEEVQRYGCGALATMASSDENSSAIQQAGGQAMIVAAMRKSSGADVQLQRNGCLALLNLALENRMLVETDNAIEVIVNAMGKHREDVEVQRSGCQVLWRLGGCSRAAIRNAGGVQIITEALRSHSEDMIVQVNGRAALVLLDSSSSGVPQRLSEEDILHEGRLAHILEGHTSFVWAVAVSPDGQRVASAGWEGLIKIWDPYTGLEVSTLKGHTSNVRAIAFSSDGRRLASGGGDVMLKIWDVQSGQELHSVIKAHRDVIWGLRFSPDSSSLVYQLTTASEDHNLKVWDVSTQGCVQVERLRGHTQWVRACAYSQDGKFMASASDDDTVIIWDARSWVQVTVLTGHESAVKSVAFSPNSSLLLSSSADRTIRAYSTQTWGLVKTFRGHEGTVHCIAFSADGRLVVSSSVDRTVRIWNYSTRHVVAVMRGHTNNIRSCAFISPTRIVSASDDTTLRVWDIEQALNEFDASLDGQGELESSSDESNRAGQRLCIKTIAAHRSFVWSCALSPDRKRLLTTCWDASAKVWNVNTTWSEIATNIQHEKNIRCCAWAPSTVGFPGGQWIVTGSGDYTMKIWDTNSFALVCTLSGHTDVVWGCEFSSDAKLIASASEDRTVRIWSTKTWQQVAVLKGHLDWVRCVAFSPDGTRIITGADDEMIKIWDTWTGHEVATLRGHMGVLRRAVFSPDGSRVASAGGDKTVRFWDASNGEYIGKLMGHAKLVNWVEYSHDGNLVATAAGDGLVMVWDVQSLRLVGTLKGHTKDVHCVRFIDRNRIVSVSDDTTIKVWNISAVVEDFTGSSTSSLTGSAPSSVSGVVRPTGNPRSRVATRRFPLR